MLYRVEIAAKAHKDLRGLDRESARRVLQKLVLLEEHLGGDVSRLTEFRQEEVAGPRVAFDELLIEFDVRRETP